MKGPWGRSWHVKDIILQQPCMRRATGAVHTYALYDVFVRGERPKELPSKVSNSRLVVDVEISSAQSQASVSLELCEYKSLCRLGAG